MRLDSSQRLFPAILSPHPLPRVLVAAWISVLILLAATSRGSTLLTAWLFLAFLVARAGFRRLETRWRRAATGPEVGELAGKGAEDPGRVEGGDHDLTPKDEEARAVAAASDDVGANLDPAAKTSSGPTKARRARVRRRGQREPLPEPPSMTLIRVGPGRYIRAEDPVSVDVASPETMAQGEADGGEPIPPDPSPNANLEVGWDEEALPDSPGDDRQPEGVAVNGSREALESGSEDEARVDPASDAAGSESGGGRDCGVESGRDAHAAILPNLVSRQGIAESVR